MAKTTKKPTGKKASSTGSPSVDMYERAKNFKAPKDYKPLSTGEKALMATMFIPSGAVTRVASTAGKLATKAAAKKYVTKAGETVTKKFTQGGRTSVVTTPPKRTGAGPSSPVKGTKAEVTKTKRSQSPKQQAASNEGRKTRTTVEKIATRAQGLGVGATLMKAMDKKTTPKAKPTVKAKPKAKPIPKYVPGKPGSGGGVGTTRTPGWSSGRKTM